MPDFNRRTRQFWRRDFFAYIGSFAVADFSVEQAETLIAHKLTERVSL